MRKEYPALTSQGWKASAFPNWTPVTELFKELRNTDQHESLIRIIIIQSQVYYADKVEIDESGGKVYKKIRMTVEYSYDADASLEKELPNEADIDMLDKQGNPVLRLVPSERYFEFHLEGRTSKIKKLIENTGTHDIYELTSEGYKTLTEYYKFYKIQLAANRKV